MVEKLYANDFFTTSTQTIAVEPRAPQWVFPEHTHNFNEVVIVNQGQGSHILNNKPYELRPGMMFYIKASDHHLYEKVHNLHLTNVLFRDVNQFDYLQDIRPLLPDEQTEPQSHWFIDKRSEHKIQMVITELTQQALSNAYQECLFFQLLLLLQQNRYIEQAGVLPTEEKIKKIIRWLQINFQQEIEWETIAAQFDLPLRTLHRRLKSWTGQTPQRYLTQLRLAEAYYQLRHSDNSITTIALECGFNDSAYFSTCFKNEFDITPRDLRACSDELIL